MLISKEDTHKARLTNLIGFCEKNSYVLKQERNGDYRVTGYAGLIIKDNYYFRHSTNESGNALDFCMNILEMKFQDAVEALLNVNSVVEELEGACLWQSQAEQKKKVGFKLPIKAAADSVLYPYLCKVRKVPLKIVKSVIEKGLLFQDDKNNCVFPCYDHMRIAKGAILRGTYDDNAYKGRAVQSDMDYGWVFGPDEYSNKVIVVEAPIDAMSLMALYPERIEKNYLLALGGLHLNAIKTFLSEHRQVAKIVLALDNDAPAKEFIEKVRMELELNYKIDVFMPVGVKDWNEMLKQNRTA